MTRAQFHKFLQWVQCARPNWSAGRTHMSNSLRAVLSMVTLISVSCGAPPDRDMGFNRVGGGPGNFGSGSGSTGGGAGSTGGGGDNLRRECNVGSDCAYWYCECSGTTTPVNSRTCNNGQCAGVTTACTNGCASFGRTWTGRTFNSNSTGGGGGSSSTGLPGSACSSRFDCNPLTCGCTDGAVLTVRECFNSFCNTKSAACSDACFDTNHGDWDGR